MVRPVMAPESAARIVKVEARRSGSSQGKIAMCAVRCVEESQEVNHGNLGIVDMQQIAAQSACFGQPRFFHVDKASHKVFRWKSKEWQLVLKGLDDANFLLSGQIAQAMALITTESVSDPLA
ncbi:hypothetical protein DTO217A2_1816 [Paecilomyces variotii]|nr:hypothetical protein DTO217A2_1816 [Paecilomyces variotii]